MDASPLSGLSALVVDPDVAERAFCLAMLSSAGLAVTGAEGFPSARTSLFEQPPAVLVAEIRLQRYNGLHLALLGRALRPNMAIVLTSTYRDRVLQREAEAIGATFVLKPLTTGQLLAAVYRTVLPEPNADGTIEPRRSKPDDDDDYEMAGVGLRAPTRRRRRQKSRTATFLLLESLKSRN